MRNRAIWTLAIVVTTACADAAQLETVARVRTFPGSTEPVEICDPASGAFTTDGTNPYFPLVVGSQRLLAGTDAGTRVELRITVLDEIQVVDGVPTRILEEYETEDGVLVERSLNFFVQAVGGGVPDGATSPRDGTVCYYGERVDIFHDDGSVTHEGEWRAGVDGALPGIVMPGVVAAGQAYLQEVAVGVAEDRAWHTQLVNDRLVVLEDTPLEPDALSLKVYRRSVGLVRDDDLKLVSLEMP